MGHLLRPTRITIGGLMWSVLLAASGLATCRAFLLADREVQLLIASAVLTLVGGPAVALGIAALARWIFTPPPSSIEPRAAARLSPDGDVR
jgi:hypothetical protein